MIVTMEELSKVRAGFESLDPDHPHYDDELKRRGTQLKEAISRVAFFEDETYFCNGTFLDIVGNTQVGTSFPLKSDDYLDSFLENLGDLIKDFHEIHSKDQDVFLISGSKYLSRMVNAGIKILRLKKNTPKRLPAKLTRIYKVSSEIKKKIRTGEISPNSNNSKTLLSQLKKDLEIKNNSKKENNMNVLLTIIEQVYHPIIQLFYSAK